MDILRKLFRFFAEYFVFFAGFIFIFVIGLLYALIKPEGIINLVFLLIVVGWVIFVIRYFWELMEKHKK